MRRGFLYLVAIMDWHSRKVLAWRLSNSMDADFCVEALKEALTRHGKELAEHHDFPDLKAFGRIESRRETGGNVQTSTRYFALSWGPAPEVFMATVRAH